MGLHASCLDSNRLLTIPESIEKTYTNDELTEFLANSSFLFPEEVKCIRQMPLQSLKNFEIQPHLLYKSVYKKKIELSTTVSPVADKGIESKKLNRNNRIYSSNAFEYGINIIETINPSHSYYSTNANSKMTSRSVSPLIRSRNTLME